jgi:hypothetical protein
MAFFLSAYNYVFFDPEIIDSDRSICTFYVNNWFVIHVTELHRV